MREVENGVRQARRLTLLIQGALARPEVSPLSPAVACELNQLAVDGLIHTAGRLRERSDIEIFGSRHVLPSHERVPGLLDEACALVAARWSEDALFLAAYVLWRLCWIHPFEDGNGRTARAASYLVLSVRLGFEIPGSSPIPARLKHAPIAYARALEAADAACARGVLDVSVLQALLAFHLEGQLRGDPPSLP
jgi:Fic family protein